MEHVMMNVKKVIHCGWPDTSKPITFSDFQRTDSDEKGKFMNYSFKDSTVNRRIVSVSKWQ